MIIWNGRLIIITCNCLVHLGLSVFQLIFVVILLWECDNFLKQVCNLSDEKKSCQMSITILSHRTASLTWHHSNSKRIYVYLQKKKLSYLIFRAAFGKSWKFNPFSCVRWCKWRGQNKKLVFGNFADLHIEFFFAHETKQGKVASKAPSIFHYAISFVSPCIRFSSKSHFFSF